MSDTLTVTLLSCSHVHINICGRKCSFIEIHFRYSRSLVLKVPSYDCKKSRTSFVHVCSSFIFLTISLQIKKGEFLQTLSGTTGLECPLHINAEVYFASTTVAESIFGSFALLNIHPDT